MRMGLCHSEKCLLNKPYEECMTGISKLVDDPDLLLQMKVNNRQYYENYLRPDMLIKQVLKIVEAD